MHKSQNIIKRALACVLIFSMTLYGGAGDSAEAASKNDRAKRAYAKMLYRKNSADAKFALLDINQDGVSELIFTRDGGYHVEISGFVRGKVKEVGGGFSGSQKYYPDRHVYFSRTTHTGVDSDTYYTFTGKKMKAVAEKYGSATTNVMTGKPKSNPVPEQFAPYKYTVNGKRVTASAYKSYVLKLLSGAKAEKPFWHKNTAKNRKKYL